MRLSKNERKVWKEREPDEYESKNWAFVWGILFGSNEEGKLVLSFWASGIDPLTFDFNLTL